MGGEGAMVRPPQAAKSKGRQNFNEKSKNFALKNFKLLRQNKIQKIIAIFFKYVIPVRGGHFDYSPRVPIKLATPLGYRILYVP
jgi:hypothetical protein